MTRVNIKDGGDVVAGLLAYGTLADLLPAVAAFLAIVWTGIRIYEWARVRLWGKPPTKLTD